MKSIAKCKGCGEDFECTDENEESKVIEKTRIIYYYKCHCGHKDEYDIDERKYVPLTVEEAWGVVGHLQRGIDHKYLLGNVDLKIGTLKKCDDCGSITDVVDYTGLASYDSNWNMECECQRKAREGEKPWFEQCKDDDCEFHKDWDVVKLRKEHDEYREIDRVLDEIFTKYPPKDDGIMELDRLTYMFENMYPNCNGYESRGYVFKEMIKYCAEKGLLRK